MPRSCESDRRTAFEQAKASSDPALARSIGRLQLNAAPHPDSVPREMLNDLCHEMAEDLGRFLTVVVAEDITGKATSRQRFKLLRGMTRTASVFLAQYISAGEAGHSLVDDSADQ